VSFQLKNIDLMILMPMIGVVMEIVDAMIKEVIGSNVLQRSEKVRVNSGVRVRVRVSILTLNSAKFDFIIEAQL
jgi:hypothetical protein